MKKEIAILGSTGSIGKSLVSIIKNDLKNFKINLLSANKNYHVILDQVKTLNVKNVIITDYKSYKIFKKKTKRLNINVYNNYDNLGQILKKKIDYTMSSISGLDGLKPTLKIIQHTKNIAIANKESIICAWSLIKKKLNKYNTRFIPVDSEHFSIWYALNKNEIKNIDQIYITASGGPLLRFPYKKFDKINIKQTLKHPNWKMGKKISIDSATMMNKVFELIEASKIFNLSLDKIKIFIEPSSYIHAIIKYNNGMIKLIAHDTTMKIPIFNTLYYDVNKKYISKDLNILKLNNLEFLKIDKKKYPVINIIKLLKNNNSMFETILVSANDTLVDLYLKKKIKFTMISKTLINILKSKEFIKYRNIKPNSYQNIEKLNKYVRLKILSMSV